jgi:hypothetical protein
VDCVIYILHSALLISHYTFYLGVSKTTALKESVGQKEVAREDGKPYCLSNLATSR